eukprot:COSAG03_NODE_4161_length_1656_cov_3.524727_4_plen_73_part_00
MCDGDVHDSLTGEEKKQVRYSVTEVTRFGYIHPWELHKQLANRYELTHESRDGGIPAHECVCALSDENTIPL